MASKTVSIESLALRESVMPWVNEMMGCVFGSLTVEKYVGHNNGVAYVQFRCQCGTLSIASAHHIRTGRTSSCGCFRRATTAKRLTKHGYAPLRGRRMKSYKTWQGMMRRCSNPHDNHFAYYGGRGIKVCARWHDFTKFLEDMGEPESGMSIERVDNDRDYCPENCKWIPHRDQAKNRRYNWRVVLNGEEMSARDASRKLGLNRHAVAARLRAQGCDKSNTVTL